MLAADTANALSSGASPDSSNLRHEGESEDDDGWVVVKKQRVIILVPPPSPVSRSPETNNIQTKSRRIIKRSGSLRKRWHKLPKSESKKPASGRTPPKDETKVAGTGIRSRSQKHNRRIAAMPEKFHRPEMMYACSDKKNIPVHTETKTSKPLVGALSVMNQRLRALNLEKKLKEFGGVRSWLVSQGLDRFIAIFEREKLGKYQLVNLTMSKLKDMGTDAVGPRRKLMHAIDRFCQPYFFKAPSAR